MHKSCDRHMSKSMAIDYAPLQHSSELRMSRHDSHAGDGNLLTQMGKTRKEGRSGISGPRCMLKHLESRGNRSRPRLAASDEPLTLLERHRGGRRIHQLIVDLERRDGYLLNSWQAGNRRASNRESHREARLVPLVGQLANILDSLLADIVGQHMPMVGTHGDLIVRAAATPAAHSSTISA